MFKFKIFKFSFKFRIFKFEIKFEYFYLIYLDPRPAPRLQLLQRAGGPGVPSFKGPGPRLQPSGGLGAPGPSAGTPASAPPPLYQYSGHPTYDSATLAIPQGLPASYYGQIGPGEVYPMSREKGGK